MLSRSVTYLLCGRHQLTTAIHTTSVYGVMLASPTTRLVAALLRIDLEANSPAHSAHNLVRVRTSLDREAVGLQLGSPTVVTGLMTQTGCL